MGAKMGPDRKPVLGADGKPEINWMPRPQISCAQDVSDGMGIRTDSPLAQECRKGVMEFLLINHPLDCPICDQAGECKLQEYSVQYGNDHSRFTDDKVKKPKRVDIGERIVVEIGGPAHWTCRSHHSNERSFAACASLSESSVTRLRAASVGGAHTR